MATLIDRLDLVRFYLLACLLFDEFWNDSGNVGKGLSGKRVGQTTGT